MKKKINTIFYDLKKTEDNIRTIQLGRTRTYSYVSVNYEMILYFPDEVDFSLYTERKIVEFSAPNMKRQS